MSVATTATARAITLVTVANLRTVADTMVREAAVRAAMVDVDRVPPTLEYNRETPRPVSRETY